MHSEAWDPVPEKGAVGEYPILGRAVPGPAVTVDGIIPQSELPAIVTPTTSTAEASQKVLRGGAEEGTQVERTLVAPKVRSGSLKTLSPWTLPCNPSAASAGNPLARPSEG